MMSKTKPRVVVCSAIKLVIESEFSSAMKIIVGPRHWDLTMIKQSDESFGKWKELEQGFIDQYGTFMTREEAWQVAEAAGQIKYRVPNDEGHLFSENLY